MGDAEVDEDRIAVQEKHIGRFDVAVDHGGGMDRVDGGRQTDRDPVQVLGREWAVAVDDVIERRPGHPAGDDIGDRAVDVGIDDGRDVRAGDPSKGIDLAPQPGARGGVVMVQRAQHLEGDSPALPVERQVHDAHAAFAEALDHAVATDDRVLGEVIHAEVLGHRVLHRHDSTVCRGARFPGQAHPWM